MFRNTTDSYGLISRALHWCIAALIFGLIVLGWYMVDLTYYDRWYNASLSWHKTLGMLVLLLGGSFAIWKGCTRTPEYPASVPRWQQNAATAAHHLLITMMLLIPITGYLVSTSAGKPVEVFNWFSLPALIPVSDRLRDIAIAIHFWCAYGTGLLALGHASAALKHHFIDKDGILRRML